MKQLRLTQDIYSNTEFLRMNYILPLKNNSQRIKKYFFVFTILFFIACKPTTEYELHGYTQKIIVEGYIGAGEYPRVYLTLNNPFYQQIDSSNILKNVIRTAKVTVSDGLKSEILTAQWEKEHFPPFVYRGTELRGEEGKSYYLRIDYSGYMITGKTSIPHAPEIIRFTTLPVQNQENMRTLLMDINIVDRSNGFRVYTKKSIDKSYVESPFVYNENLNLSGENTFIISPKPTKNDLSYNEAGYFKANTNVYVRVVSIDSVSTLFFKSLTMFSTNGIAKNIFISENIPLPSNVTTPGFGIWYGYHAKIYSTSIK
ncbi:MAG: hypothetical protein QM751_04870 [Paludibacteraceae bacterium]